MANKILLQKKIYENPKKQFNSQRKISVSICVYLWTILLCLAVNAQTLAPGAPGKDAQWATAGKQGVGTSASLESKVWFTLAQGVMTEVYYPDVTVANVHLLQFIVIVGKDYENERDDATHEIKVLRNDALSFQQINTAKSGKWRITKTYTTDVERNTVLIDVKAEKLVKDNSNFELYVYYDPSLNNSGMHDTAWRQSGALLSQEGDISSALVYQGKNLNSSFRETNNGFLGTSGGIDYLKKLQDDFFAHPKQGTKLRIYDRAENGNVTQTGQIQDSLKIERTENQIQFTLALGFGKTPEGALQTAKSSLQKGFIKCLAEYEKGWADYVKTLRKVEPRYQAQFNMAAMILKAHEDKTHRGANIASLSVPWGGGANANEKNVGGYHLVWSRDLYQVATAFMALGDKDAATRALDFLFKVQQKPDGSFPQNSWLDGKPFWESLQLDEVAYPLILAYQLGKTDKATYENHVKRAADFIVKNGPRTPQERWEEEAGFSPSTIAAEIAGLICAADIARKNGDEASATIYTATADDWARKVEMWTATTTGKYGDGNYYLRITGNGKPDAGEKIELNNGAGFFDEREIVDAGFLELVRLGIKPADDPLIQKSLKVIDEVIRVQTPNGDAFYRYNHDGYGEMDDGRRWNWDGKYTGKGRLWALLSGERGQYELAFANMKGYPVDAVPQAILAKSRLNAMLGFANEGLMIPEQIWNKAETPKNIDKQFVPELKFGEGTGSATPLAWSMAQFIRLAVNLQAGRNLDTPDIVYNRYVKNGIPGQVSNFGGMDENAILPVNAGEKFSFSRDVPKGTKIGYVYGGKTHFIEVGDEAKFTVEVVAPEKEELVVVGIETPDGATAFERVKVRSADKIEPQKFSPATIEKIKTAKTNPVIENGKAILFYRGAAKNVMAAGDFSGWNPNAPLFKVGENLFAREFDFPSNARIEYRLVVDGKWMTDEFNPNKLDNGVGGENSFFAMPDYKPTNWDKDRVANVDGFGKVKTVPNFETFEIDSKIYGKKAVKVYLPPNEKMPLPILYLQDGSDYINRAKAIQTQYNLVSAGKTKPFIMVFLDPKERTKEYWANDDYAKFVAEEVVPAVDKEYNTIKSRNARAILGASLGGVTSFHVALKYPEIFSRVGGQSSSFWIDNERVVKALEKLDASKTKFTFYLDDGTFEGTEDSRRVNVMLRGKGFPVTYVEGATGHNWTSWRDRLADAFVGIWK